MNFCIPLDSGSKILGHCLSKSGYTSPMMRRVIGLHPLLSANNIIRRGSPAKVAGPFYGLAQMHHGNQTDNCRSIWNEPWVQSIASFAANWKIAASREKGTSPVSTKVSRCPRLFTVPIARIDVLSSIGDQCQARNRFKRAVNWFSSREQGIRKPPSSLLRGLFVIVTIIFNPYVVLIHYCRFHCYVEIIIPLDFWILLEWVTFFLELPQTRELLLPMSKRFFLRWALIIKELL